LDYASDVTKEDEMGGACGGIGVEDKFIPVLRCGGPEEKRQH
jgi:hypothetical protein